MSNLSRENISSSVEAFESVSSGDLLGIACDMASTREYPLTLLWVCAVLEERHGIAPMHDTSALTGSEQARRAALRLPMVLAYYDGILGTKDRPYQFDRIVEGLPEKDVGIVIGAHMDGIKARQKQEEAKGNGRPRSNDWHDTRPTYGDD